MGWKKWGAALLLCVTLTGCGAGGDSVPEAQEQEQQEQKTAGERESGGESAESGAQEREQSGESISAADDQEEDGGMNGDYSVYFQDIQLTESYKGTEDSNPLMTQRFGADPYAMEYDGRVYFYMTADALEYEGEDVRENTYSTIHSINVISTADMVNFTDHGSIEAAGSQGAAKWASNSWAPAAPGKTLMVRTNFSCISRTVAAVSAC